MSHIQIRIDKNDKDEARKVLDKLGLDMSTAIKMFLRQTAIRKGLPFLVTAENELSLEGEEKIQDTFNGARQSKKLNRKPDEKKALERFKPFLWSYDFERLDLEKDKKRIITNVLNLGTKEATDELFKIYSEEEIKEVLLNPRPGEWSKKSLNFWSIIFNIEVKNVLRYSR